ncbi:hypothetical protein V2J09_011621 [Rumex salicifolius]
MADRPSKSIKRVEGENALCYAQRLGVYAKKELRKSGNPNELKRPQTAVFLFIITFKEENPHCKKAFKIHVKTVSWQHAVLALKMTVAILSWPYRDPGQAGQPITDPSCLLPFLYKEARLACLRVLILNKLAGILPLRLLMDTSTHCSLSNNPKPAGMVPLIWFRDMFNPSPNSGRVPEIKFLETSMDSRKLLVLLPRIFVRDPKNWFELRSMDDKSSGSVIIEMSYFSLLLDRSKEVKELGFAKSGSVPDSLHPAKWTAESSLLLIQLGTVIRSRLLKDRSMDKREGMPLARELGRGRPPRLPRLDGIGPCNRFPPKERVLRELMWPIPKGMTPVRALSSRISCVRCFKLERLLGMTPLMYFIPLIISTSRKGRTRLVTLPVEGLQLTPSQSPPQQSVPTHEERIPVVSVNILDLKLRSAALSAGEQAEDQIQDPKLEEKRTLNQSDSKALDLTKVIVGAKRSSETAGLKLRLKEMRSVSECINPSSIHPLIYMRRQKQLDFN